MKGIVSLILVSLMFGCGNDSSQENEEIISEVVPDKFGLITGSKLSGLNINLENYPVIPMKMGDSDT